MDAMAALNGKVLFNRPLRVHKAHDRVRRCCGVPALSSSCRCLCALLCVWACFSCWACVYVCTGSVLVTCVLTNMAPMACACGCDMLHRGVPLSVLLLSERPLLWPRVGIRAARVSKCGGACVLSRCACSCSCMCMHVSCSRRTERMGCLIACDVCRGCGLVCTCWFVLLRASFALRCAG